MTFVQILDAAALAVLAAQAGWIAMLYRRMGRLRTALDTAGDVVGQIDAASKRLDASAGGIVQKVKDGMGEVDSKITACRRVAQELTAASRQAEEVATRLDQALRLNRKLQTARAAAPPRELAEPLGLAERLAGRAPPVLQAVLAHAPPPLNLLEPAPDLTDRMAAVAVERLLAAELIYPPVAPAPAPAQPERRVFRLTLD